MTEPTTQSFTVAAEQAQQTLAACLRLFLPGQTWKQVRQLIDNRHIKLNGEVWVDPARRVREGDTVEILSRPAPKPKLIDNIVIRHIDDHIIVVEKPSGVPTVRHPSERQWEEERRLRVPTLDDLVLRQIGARFPKRGQGKKPRLRIVHRLDKDTSGLVVFGRSLEAERGLGIQFAKHRVTRRYLAMVRGRVATQTIKTHLVRDRGDGRRGSSPGDIGKEAITHVEALEKLPGYTLLSCRLETGRTHQIRIHLSEQGHPVCGEKVYNRQVGGEAIPDLSGCPRLFLHAVELGFQHPVTMEEMHWEMPLPEDLRDFLESVRQAHRGEHGERKHEH